MQTNRLLLTALILLSCIGAHSQIQLTKNRKPTAHIVLADTTLATRQAARLLNTFISRMGNQELPIVAKEKGKNTVVIGHASHKAGEDGFEISCTKGRLTILSGGDKGAALGVAHLLKRFLDCDYLTKQAWKAPRNENIMLPAIDHWTETPAFRYRQSQSYGNQDELYRLWFGFEEPEQIFAGRLWVHTFNRILPSSRYGKTHPEWYSMINGRRQPGDHSQWCLTNPELFKEVCRKLDSIFAAHPDLKLISVSQNDGNNTNCTCNECKAVDEYEGAVSGNYIHFMNKLATRYPDKEFSTLAYLFTMNPPKHVKPLPNVNIMLCDIDSRREVPLTDNKSGQEFVKAMEGWSKLTNNIFVWDYGINFDNVVAPFPNFHILQKNIQLFRQHHANMLFEQVNGSIGTDFAELRAYMIGNLMWNPDIDADRCMNDFLCAYYGKAAPYMYRYLQLQQGALLASGKELWIYDSPITHKDGMLNAPLRKAYNELFDKAEKAVSDNSEELKRVRISRLPLMYSELEIARTQTGTDAERLRQMVSLFRDRCTEYGIPTLNERKNSPAEYCDLYLKRYLPSNEVNKALGAKVTFIAPPAERYRKSGLQAITDGLHGGTSYVEGWVGWEGKDAEFVIDLGKEESITTLSADFLHQLGAWVLLPKSVSYAVSTDNKTFTPFGNTYEFAEDRDVKIKFVQGTVTTNRPVVARYIKVKVETLGQCPAWHYGVGYPAWFFLDEVRAQ